MNGTVHKGSYLRLPEINENEVIGRMVSRHSISMPNLTVDFTAEQPDSCEPKATSSLFDRIKLYLLYKLWFMGTVTSFDGVRFAAVGYPLVRTIMWVVLFCFSVAAMIWSITFITNLYLARDTSFTRQKHFPQSLNFPAVTICNHNPYYNIVTSTSCYCLWIIQEESISWNRLCILFKPTGQCIQYFQYRIQPVCHPWNNSKGIWTQVRVWIIALCLW